MADRPMKPRPPASPTRGAGRRRAEARGALAYCARPAHLRRTTRIAFAVGLLLTAINQGAVIASGDATIATWIRCALNFCVPFVVSNLGLLSGRPRPDLAPSPTLPA